MSRDTNSTCNKKNGKEGNNCERGREIERLRARKREGERTRAGAKKYVVVLISKTAKTQRASVRLHFNVYRSLNKPAKPRAGWNNGSKTNPKHVRASATRKSKIELRMGDAPRVKKKWQIKPINPTTRGRTYLPDRFLLAFPLFPFRKISRIIIDRLTPSWIFRARMRD